jgi:hypothetical protein
MPSSLRESLSILAACVGKCDSDSDPHSFGNWIQTQKGTVFSWKIMSWQSSTTIVSPIWIYTAPLVCIVPIVSTHHRSGLLLPLSAVQL